MRDPKRLTPFYDRLREIHAQRFPDWRFGQLCCNFFGWLVTEKGLDPFFPEEDQMLNYIEEFSKN